MKSPRIFSIVPPYILENIIRNGSTDERKWAKKTLQFDQQFRQQRASIMGQTQPDNQSQVQTQEEKLPCDHLTRKVFTADNKRKTPGRLLRDENTPPVGDDAIDELHDALKLTYRFFCEVFARPTIEGDSTLEATAHYGVNFANAFWESSGKRVVFGDGDGRYFERFSVALEVIAHEMTHGLIEAETRLEYRSQPGALCESLADVFGCLVKQYTLNQTVQQADWLMGVGVYTSAVQGIALRSLGQPGTAYDDPVLGKDPQPAHMRDFVRLKNTRNGDFGGVHINCSIPSLAFYLTAREIDQYAWKKTGSIWYNALCDKALRPNFGFHRFARLTLKHAVKLFGDNSTEVRALQASWDQVGISV